MLLIEHLLELRRRFLISIVMIGAGTVISYFFAPTIIQILAHPMILAGGEHVRMISTAPQEIFITYLKVSFWAGLCLAFPVIATQIWTFIAPGLYTNERSAFLPFLVATPLLFIAGGLLVYFVIMPITLSFFLGFQVPAGEGLVPISPEIRVSEYISLTMSLIFAFGLCFQLPVVLTLLARVGIITAESLSRQRRLVVVAIFMVAAVATPPDVLSQVSLALPLVGLYEASILLARRMGPSRG